MSERWPIDVPKRRVLKTFENLGFKAVRIGNHISLVRENPDGTRTPATIPNHSRLKGSTLRRICSLSGVSRKEFLAAYRAS